MIKHFRIAALACATCWASAASAGVIYSNDFSSNDSGFSGDSTLTTSPSSNQFLYFGGAGGSGTLTLTGLAPGSDVSLAFDLYAVGSLDGNGAIIDGGGSGDYFDVSTGSGTIFSQAFCNYGNGETQSYPTNPSACGTGAYATNSLGYTGFPQGSANLQDAEYAFDLSAVADSSGTIAFTFLDDSNEGTGNEFYGIDNVVVSGTNSTTTVPEPATWATMLAALGMLGFAMRRRAKVSASGA